MVSVFMSMFIWLNESFVSDMLLYLSRPLTYNITLSFEQKR